MLGVGDGLAGLLLDDPRVRWWVEAGERALFDIPELRVTQVQAGLRHGGSSVLLSTAMLATPLGREFHGAIEAVSGNAGPIGLSVEVGLWGLAIADAAPARLACISAAVSAPVFAKIAVAYLIDNVRIAGEALRGADTSVIVVATPRPYLALVAGARVTRDGEVGAWVASRVQWGRRLEAAFGYDDGTAMLKSSLVVRAGIDIGVGASTHPVLGLSKSIFLRWTAR